jgi:hypothetical protein
MRKSTSPHWHLEVRYTSVITGDKEIAPGENNLDDSNVHEHTSTFR